MEFGKTSQLYSLNKSTYINLRWIGIIGQFITINSVRFIFDFEFNYIFANLIILIGAISNLFLIFFYKKTHLSNRSAFNFLLIDIIQLAALLYLSGGILNPFAIFLLIPSVFASSSLDIKTNIILISFTILCIILLTFYHEHLPAPLDQSITNIYIYYLSLIHI